jgi:hypothetical protein
MVSRIDVLRPNRLRVGYGFERGDSYRRGFGAAFSGTGLNDDFSLCGIMDDDLPGVIKRSRVVNPARWDVLLHNRR